MTKKTNRQIATPADQSKARDTKAGRLSVATAKEASSEQRDLRPIACNTASGSSGYSSGSLAYIQRMDGDRVKILVRSRGGRWIKKWLSLADVTNFRIKRLPCEHPLYPRVTDWSHHNRLNTAIQNMATRSDHLRSGK